MEDFLLSVMYQYWLNKAHSAIPKGYESAILHYSKQKEDFLQKLQEKTSEPIQDFVKQLNDEIDLEVMNELDDTFDEAFNAVKSYLETYIVQLMQDGNADYSQLLSRFQLIVKKGAEGKINPNNLYNNLLKDIELFLSKNNVTKSGLAQYVANHSGLKNTQNIDIQNNLFGYARKLILAQLQGDFNHSTINYKKSLKGYYKEELLVPALNKILSSYGVEAKQTGSIKDDKGLQIKYDIILGTTGTSKIGDELLMPLIKQMEAFSQTQTGLGSVSTIQTVNLLGGLQSKSWIAPWSTRSKGGNRKFLDFGHNSNLMPTGEDAHYWHAGVYNVMSNLINAVGVNNFIFATGDTVYWTTDLLAEFREQQYVLAFYYNKKEEKITSASISAQSHYC